MSEPDIYDKRAEELLPCKPNCHWNNYELHAVEENLHAISCVYKYRPAVAAELRIVGAREYLSGRSVRAREIVNLQAEIEKLRVDNLTLKAEKLAEAERVTERDIAALEFFTGPLTISQAAEIIRAAQAKEREG